MRPIHQYLARVSTRGAALLAVTSAALLLTLASAPLVAQASPGGSSSASSSVVLGPIHAMPIRGKAGTHAHRDPSASVATVVFDLATNAPWSGSETTGAAAYDTATVTASGAGTPTGTVTYTFFSNNGCSGTGTAAGTVSLSGGTVPRSNAVGPLTAGAYSFQAAYSGDGNYGAATSPCEPFSVLPPVSEITRTNATCSQFASGTAAILPAIGYVRSLGKIVSVMPGAFFYWVKVSAPGTYTISQSVGGSRGFAVNEPGSIVHDAACHTVSGGASIAQSSDLKTITVTFSSTASGPFYIQIAFSTSTLVGQPAPLSIVTYRYSTVGVPGSTSSVFLAPLK